MKIWNYNAAQLGISPLEEIEDAAIESLVRIAQTHLALEVDGMFGPKTAAAVEAWRARTSKKPARGPRNQRSADALAFMRAFVGRTQMSDPRTNDASTVRLGYGMGYGGKALEAAHPFERAADGVYRCDCSGALARAYRWRRHVTEGGADFWRNTDGLEADARGTVPGDLGHLVPWAEACPGDVLVYGKGPQVGHCGTVGDVDEHGPATVIHCNGRGGAPIDETPPAVGGFTPQSCVVLAAR